MLHLQSRVGAGVLIGGPAAIAVLVGQDDVNAVLQALLRDAAAHLALIQLCQGQARLHACPALSLHAWLQAGQEGLQHPLFTAAKV